MNERKKIAHINGTSLNIALRVASRCVSSTVWSTEGVTMLSPTSVCVFSYVIAAAEGRSTVPGSVNLTSRIAVGGLSYCIIERPYRLPSGRAFLGHQME